MTVTAASCDQVLLLVGDIWVLRVVVTNVDGARVDQEPVFTVTPPSGAPVTPTPERRVLGDYRATYAVALTGRHVATAVTVDYGSAVFAAYVQGVTTAAGMPTVDDVAAYMGAASASWTAAQLQGALDAEAAAQRAICLVGAVYPADLREALLRRVQRNLAMRQLPLAVLQGDAETGSNTVLPGRDPEVRRLEAPYRRLVVG